MDSRAADPQGRILAAASRVFAAHGFNGGSLNDIAIGAEMTRPGVLHHFPSKQAVLLALLEKRDRELGELALGSDEWNLRELYAGLAGQFEVILRNRELVQLAHSLTAEASQSGHPARAWVVARHNYFRKKFADAVLRSQREGEISPNVDPVAVAAGLLGVIEGIENQWLVAPDDFDAIAALDVVFQGLVIGLAPAPNLD